MNKGMQLKPVIKILFQEVFSPQLVPLFMQNSFHWSPIAPDSVWPGFVYSTVFIQQDKGRKKNEKEGEEISKKAGSILKITLPGVVATDLT